LKETQEIRLKAIKLLAIREHGCQELKRKLLVSGFENTLIDQVLEQLKAENLQSDIRFSTSYINSRANRGYGLLRIKLELKGKGISPEVITHALDEVSIDWSQEINKVWYKKFKSEFPSTPKEKVKQWRFLQYRGFSQDLISELFKNCN